MAGEVPSVEGHRICFYTGGSDPGGRGDPGDRIFKSKK